LSGVHALTRAARAARADARLIVIAGVVVIAVVVAALGIGGADGTRPLTPGRRIGGLVVIAATVVLAVTVTALGVRGAGPTRNTAKRVGVAAGIIVVAAADHTRGAHKHRD
jgi:hypothetical protein